MSAESPLLPDGEGSRRLGALRTRRTKKIAGFVAVACVAALAALVASVALVHNASGRSVLVAEAQGDDNLDFR
jgi:hypothetical protein